MSNNEVPKNRVLPPKEASNFRSALKLYESKQYKKALKTAEGVLKKHPEHGETLAVKGLVLYFMGKKDEGYESIKKGLDNDPTSYVCWHIIGIYYRQEKNYDEATKAYTKACQYDPENVNILRDLANLQVQTRQYKSLVPARTRLLKDKPGFRINWTSLALAHYFNKDYATSEKTLSSFEELLKEPLPKSDVENSEVTLFKNRVIYESGDVERALTHLEEISDKVLDQLSVSEYRAKYLLELKRFKEAEREYRALIKRNPECVSYYYALEDALQISRENLALRQLLYTRLAEKYPKSDTPRSIPLYFLVGEEFKKAVTAYLKHYLARGVPSTFVMMKPLYKDPERKQIIHEVITEMYESLLKEAADPSRTVWTIYFIAQHETYLGDHDKALEYIDQAIDHTPTLVELYMTKAKILKHMGDLESAWKAMETSRELDLQDRFVNTKAAKYMLRAGEIDRATDIISLFTRNDNNGKGVQDLHDMQGLWFLLEQAEAYSRAGDLGLALKRFHAVFNVFHEFKTDQFDFNIYCPRRGTVRSYLDMMDWGDRLANDRQYVRAVKGAVNIYVHLDEQRKRQEQHLNGDHLSNGGESADKKAQRKAKRDRAKELKKEEEEKENSSNNNDPDPLGKKLLKSEEPLTEAFNIWKPIGDDARYTENITGLKLGFELYLRQAKYVLAVQTLVKAKKAGAPQHWCVAGSIRTRHYLSSDESTPAALKAVPLKLLPTIAPEGSIAEDNLDEYADKFVITYDDAESILSWTQAKLDLNNGELTSVIEETLLTRLLTYSIIDFDTIREAYRILQDLGSTRVEEFQTLVKKKFPRATRF